MPATRTRHLRLLIRVAISVAVLALFTAHLASSPRFEFVDRVENYLYDVRIRLTMPGTVDDRIVIIDIDEASQAELGQWPWPRETLATLVDQMFDHYNVRVFALDAVFAEAEESSAARVLDALSQSPAGANAETANEIARLRAAMNGNQRFAESLIARDVVTGFVFKDSLGRNEPATTGTLPAPVIISRQLPELAVPFIEAQGFTGNIADLQDNAFAGGFFDSPLIDADGVFRRAPLVQRYNGDLYPSLALATALVVEGSPAVGLRFAADAETPYRGVDLDALTIGNRAIPVNEQVAVYIPYRGPQESFPFVSAHAVLSGDIDKNVLDGKIALLGASAAGLLDLRSTPVGNRYIGVEAHANLIAGLIDGAIRHQPAWSIGLEMTLLVIAALITAFWLPRLNPLPAFALVVVALVAAAATNLAFWNAGLIVPLATTVLYLLLASMLQITYGFFVEQRNKRHLSQVFGQYIPPSLVEEIDASDEDVSMRGETREMTVLFSDVRNFTTISEGLDATELTAMMNEFLTPFTGAIQTHRGTIDKYMGDAVMAFWGAPLVDELHARNAVCAAFDMLSVVQQLDRHFQDKGWPQIRVGIGIASGDMNVGNMGSEFRVAYTVMGDTVNLGSRLEGLTKQYGVDIIVNDRTAERLTDFTFREIDRVRVKGKTEPVSIYEPLGPTDTISAERLKTLDLYAQALDAYRNQQWAVAANLFTRLTEQADQLLYNVYLNRIERFRLSPPAEDWDGVFVHKSK